MIKQQLVNFVNNNMTKILKVGGMTGVVATAGTAYKAACDIRDFEEENEDPTILERTGAYAKALIPPFMTGIGTMVCIHGLDKEHTKRYAALMGAYVISQTDLESIRESMSEILGKDKSKEVEKNAKDKTRTVFFDEYTIYPIHDLVTGRILHCSPNDVMTAASKTNTLINRQGGAQINDFYEALGEDWTEAGSMLGWKCDGGADCIDIEWGTILDEVRIRPELTIEYKCSRTWNW